VTGWDIADHRRKSSPPYRPDPTVGRAHEKPNDLWFCLSRPNLTGVLVFQGFPQLGPGRNPELGVDAVEVRADSARGEVDLLADLAVGEPFGGQLGDLQFLRAQLIPCLGGPRAAYLPRRAQQLAGPLGPRVYPEGIEGFPGGA
jgi:hypothetical protein